MWVKFSPVNGAIIACFIYPRSRQYQRLFEAQQPVMVIYPDLPGVLPYGVITDALPVTSASVGGAGCSH